jgi:hypothetical protein
MDSAEIWYELFKIIVVTSILFWSTSKIQVYSITATTVYTWRLMVSIKNKLLPSVDSTSYLFATPHQ